MTDFQNQLIRDSFNQLKEFENATIELLDKKRFEAKKMSFNYHLYQTACIISYKYPVTLGMCE